MFGTNFLAASATLDLLIVAGAYNRIVFDTRRGVLGFDLKDEYPLPGEAPGCGDGQHPFPGGDLDFNCTVNLADLVTLHYEWNRNDCGWLSGFCGGADIDHDGFVNLKDICLFSENWLVNTYPAP